MKPSFAIQTRYGNAFDPATGLIDKIDIQDIAHALSNLCRYAGHCRRFYSVAEHSVLTYRIARKLWPDDLESQWAALLHDATEAYVGDVPTPLKILLPDFSLIEDTLADEIAKEFQFEWTQKVKHRVGVVDKEALATEAPNLFQDVSHWATLKGVNTHQELLSLGFPVASETARDEFLRCYWELKKRREDNV